jgi:hypothetical protein
MVLWRRVEPKTNACYFVEEIKTVLEFEKKIVVNANYLF